MNILTRITTMVVLGMGLISVNSSVQAAVQSGDLHYTADCGVTELRMKKGHYDVNRAGAIKGYDYCEYQFYAKKGQDVSATLIGDNDLYPVLYGTTSPDLSRETVTLDKTGEHTIRVLQPRAKARQSDMPKPFYLTVTIK